MPNNSFGDQSYLFFNSAQPVIYADSTTALGISATFTGTSRDLGAENAYTEFVASATADVAGTLNVDASTNGTTWFLAGTAAVAANGVAEVKAAVTARYYRVRYVNGAAAQATFSLRSAARRP